MPVVEAVLWGAKEHGQRYPLDLKVAGEKSFGPGEADEIKPSAPCVSPKPHLMGRKPDFHLGGVWYQGFVEKIAAIKSPPKAPGTFGLNI